MSLSSAFSLSDKTITFANNLDFKTQLLSLEDVFNSSLDLKEVNLENAHSLFLTDFGIEKTLSRKVFYQIPTLWTYKENNFCKLDHWVQTKEVTHPLRPQIHENQLLYKRYSKTLGKTLSFRVIDIEKDLDLFTEWHNKPRVNNFWELAKPKEELREYLIKGLQDPHQFPVIYEIDGVPVGYFEIYWVKEDRLGPYYESESYDRGFHLLVGNDDYLGFKNTDAMLKAMCHFLFLDDIRTRRIMAEPRHDNQAILKYIETFKAWRKVKEFDFPHKRAALLECSREKFFAGEYL